MVTYFISDLHLQPKSAENTKLFLDFLQTKAAHAEALYILGDLFALWLGDDLDQAFTQQIIAALNKLKQQNVKTYFIRGNRDFLVGEEFCQRAGLKLLQDPTVIELYGQSTLLTHGDLLCSADLSYQRYRSFVQNRFIKSIFLSLPKSCRSYIGSWVQKQASSKGRKLGKINPSIYDIAPTTLEEWIAKHNINQIIHGHTHNPAVHKDRAITRYVLGDWNPASAKIIRANQDCIQLEEANN